MAKKKKKIVFSKDEFTVFVSLVILAVAMFTVGLMLILSHKEFEITYYDVTIYSPFIKDYRVVGGYKLVIETVDGKVLTKELPRAMPLDDNNIIGSVLAAASIFPALISLILYVVAATEKVGHND